MSPPSSSSKPVKAELGMPRPALEDDSLSAADRPNVEPGLQAQSNRSGMDIDPAPEFRLDDFDEQQENEQFGFRDDGEQPRVEPVLSLTQDLRAALEDSTQPPQNLRPAQQATAPLDTSPAGIRATIAAQKALRHKRKAEEELAVQKESKTIKTASTSAPAQTVTGEDATMTDEGNVAVNPPESATPVMPVTIPSAAPQMVAVERPFIRYQDRMNFAHANTRCALKVEGEYFEPIGNPFENPLGLVITVHPDSGKHGDPMIKLRFKISKGDKNQNVPSDLKDCHVFSIIWYPGSSVRNDRMMDAFIYRGGDGINNKFVKNQSIMDMSSKFKGGAKFNDIVFISFLTSAAEREDHYEPSYAYGLPENTRKTLAALFSPGERRVHLWFISPLGPSAHTWDRLEKFFMLPLQQAVKYKEPAMKQYLNEQGEFKPDIDTFPTIQEVGGGMYVKPKANKSDVPFDIVPQAWSWKSLQEFHIYGATQVMRDRQYIKGQAVSIGLSGHRAYVEPFPQIEVDNNITGRMTDEERKYLFMYRVYIRQSRAADGSRDQQPEIGQEVELSWDNSTHFRAHTTPDKSQRLYGTVQRTVEKDLRATGCDFMFLAYKQRTASIRKSFPGDLQRMKDSELPLCHIDVKINDGPAKRELEGMRLMSDPSYEPDTLDPIRMALANAPSKMTFTKTDLTEGVATTEEDKAANRNKFTQYIDKFISLDNPARTAVLKCVREINNRIAVVQGPPGTTKTTTIAIIVSALIMCGHKVAFTAPSNPATDTAAMAVYKILSEQFKSEKYRTVRLELFGREKGNLLDDLDNGFDDPSQFKQPKNVKDPLDNPRVAQQFAKVMAEIQGNEAAYEAFERQVEAHNEAVKQVSSDLKENIANVPLEQTLGYRIYDRIQRDMAEAKAKFDARLNDITGVSEKADFMQDHDVDQFDESAGYRKIMRAFAQREGRLSAEQYQDFKDQRTMMIGRVLGEMHAIFATCVNSGSDWITEHFKPSVVCIDEAGQVTIPSACVPMTMFKEYQGLLLFGDIYQLRPTVLSAGINEFIQNSRTSLMGLLIGKGFPVFKLTMQYRSDPDITSFPAKQFYDPGDYLDHPSVKVDNDTKQKMRSVSMKYYKIKTAKGGSVYWFVNVIHGVARVEPNGTSLQNYANAGAIATAIERLLKEGIQASQISILTIYRGNINVLGDAIEQHLIRETTAAGAETRTWERTSVGIFTTDSFQGKETDIALIDLVVASDEWDSLSKTAASESDHFQSVSGHVKDPNRLCVTLTRAKFGEIVFGQAQMLLNSIGAKNMKKRRIENSVSLLVQDAIDREVMYDDDEHLDTHPEGVKAREKHSKARQLEARKVDEAKRLRFIRDRMAKLRYLPHSDGNRTEGLLVKLPDYQTGKGTTTRPAEIGLAEAADKHDNTPVSLVRDESGKPWDEEDSDEEMEDAQVPAGMSKKAAGKRPA